MDTAVTSVFLQTCPHTACSWLRMACGGSGHVGDSSQQLGLVSEPGMSHGARHISLPQQKPADDLDCLRAACTPER